MYVSTKNGSLSQFEQELNITPKIAEKQTRVKHNSKALENIKNRSYGFYSKMVEKDLHYLILN